MALGQYYQFLQNFTRCSNIVASVNSVKLFLKIVLISIYSSQRSVPMFLFLSVFEMLVMHFSPLMVKIVLFFLLWGTELYIPI